MKEEGLFFLVVRRVEGEIVFGERGHVAMDDGIGSSLVFATSTCLGGLARRVNLFGKLDGIIGGIGKEKDAGMIGGIHGWVLPAGKQRGRLELDPSFGFFLFKKGCIGGRDPEGLEKADAVVCLFLGEDLMKNILIKDDGVPGRNAYPRGSNRGGDLLKTESCFLLLHDKGIMMGGKGTGKILWLLVQINPPAENMFAFFDLVFVGVGVGVGCDDGHGSNVPMPRLLGGGGAFGTNT